MLEGSIKLIENSRDILPSLLVISSALTFSMIIIFAVLNFNLIKDKFKKIKFHTLVILFLIFLFGLFLRLSIPIYFVTYVDEMGHIEVGKNIAQEGKVQICNYQNYEERSCSLYNEAGGFPFILGASFLLFGVSNKIAYFTNIFLGSLLSILMFIFSYLLFKKKNIGLYSSLLISISPLYILFSRTIEPDIASTFFGLATLTSFLLFTQIWNSKMAFLSVSLLAFFIQIKNENLVIIVPITALLLLFNNLNLKQKIREMGNYQFFGLLLILIILITPHLIHTSLEAYPAIFYDKSTAGAPYGTYFSIKSISENIWIMENLLKGVYYPVFLNFLLFFTILSFKNYKKEIIFLFLLFITFSCLYLSYSDGFHEKYLLINFFPIICLFGIGTEKLESFLNKIIFRRISFFIIFIMLIFIASPYIDKMQKDPKSMVGMGFDRDELNYGEQEFIGLLRQKIKDDCYIVSQEPLDFAGTKIKSIKTDLALDNPRIMSNILNKTNCVFYFEGRHCTNFYSLGNRCGLEVASFEKCEELRKGIVSRCRKMHEKYNLTLNESYEFPVSERLQEAYNQSEKKVVFKVYKIMGER